MKKISLRISRVACPAFLIAGAAGCASPTDGMPEFGQTVSGVMESQSYAEGDEVPALRGDKASRDFDRYRRRGEEQPNRMEGISTDLEQ